MCRSRLEVVVRKRRVVLAICASLLAYHLSMQGVDRTWQWRMTGAWRTTTLSVKHRMCWQYRDDVQGAQRKQHEFCEQPGAADSITSEREAGAEAR
jgi:hypothetical protein